MTDRLKPAIYKIPAPELAPLLLGKLLCRDIDGQTVRLRITETEAYYGAQDSACHAHKGKTPRTELLYRRGGTAYVYLCYGIHHLLNVVSGTEGFPEAVLIRGVEGCAGPGRLTKKLRIDRTLNGENLISSDRLWLEDDGSAAEYKTGPRIGIHYAEEKDRMREWRFYAV